MAEGVRAAADHRHTAHYYCCCCRLHPQELLGQTDEEIDKMVWRRTNEGGINARPSYTLTQQHHGARLPFSVDRPVMDQTGVFMARTQEGKRWVHYINTEL